ncbi:meteorin [Poecilia reticulata]|uniref:Meteorin, glial cell differentiation regulator n=1 Tax=Poecilia reticulata TaxID=8081 RepID=A0A3P9Q0J6_POERE|nr:PREDICTED: meteorin [Poecilia reticulata]
MPGSGRWNNATWILLLAIFHSCFSSYSEDQCSWRGSGLSQQQGSVEQISLHCSEGTLDWLYPKGALRLTLTPRLAPVAAAGPGGGGVTACVKPSEQFHGAQLYLERDGLLELLVGDRMEASPPPRVRCFSRTPGERLALFLQATPHQDISRRTASFRYELRGGGMARMALDSNAISREDACRPCNDTEILMAVCTSDFVVRGNIRSVEEDETLRAAVIKVSATRVFRQKYTLFTGSGRLASRGEVRTLLQCGVRPGPGSFLFTGRVHFGEAWLGCAPRYKDFQRTYSVAKAAQQIPCELPVD